MTFFIIAGSWAAIGVVLGSRAVDADRGWQRRLTELGVLPVGPDDPMSAARHPFTFFRRRAAHLSAASRPRRLDDSAAEAWRIRRVRRWRLFYVWTGVGGVVAFALLVALEA